MHRPPTRTSISIDEAISILLGRSTGPIEFESVDDTEEAESNLPIFDLDETLEDEREVLDGEYRRAKFEKQPQYVVAEKLAALQMHEAAIVRAYDYRCAIADELNKGEQSALKIDCEFSGAARTYVTLHSFKEWARSIDIDRPEVQVSGESETRTQPRMKLRQQEEAILAEIRNQNYDPTSLPKNPSGKRGVKAAVREALKESPLFKSRTTFKRAWDTLRQDGRIADAPSSPQKLEEGDL